MYYSLIFSEKIWVQIDSVQTMGFQESESYVFKTTRDVLYMCHKK